MNDFDIIYDKKEKKFSMSIETIYMFDNGKEGEKEYIKDIFNTFTQWMISKGYDTTKEVRIYDIFTSGNNINTDFDTLEELYANFKCFVNGFVKN